MKYTFDSRAVKPGMGFVALKGEKVDGHDFIPQALANGAARVIYGLPALQQAARDYRRTLKAKVIGVTGSAGKTTTKEFLKAFLNCYGTEGNFNNQIGLPMTILNCPEEAHFLVVEMGTNHPGEIAALCDVAEPDIGVLVSVGTAHIEFFKTREGIEAEKMTLLKRAKDFGLRWDEVEPAPFACPLPGSHNASNMALAYAVARRLGVDEATCEKRLASFALPGARWRRQVHQGVTFIDDSYNANPDSMIAALKAFVSEPCMARRVVVLGDMGELGDESLAMHRKVFAFARTLPIACLVGVGPLASQCDCDRAFASVAALKEALNDVIRSGDLVLLKASHAMNLSTIMPS